MKKMDEKSLDKISKICILNLAKKISIEISKELEDKTADLTDCKGLVQGRVCQGLASFMLAHCIKIMQINDASDRVIKLLFEECIEEAFYFAKEAKLQVIREEVH